MPSLLHGQAEAGRQRRSHREVRASLRSPQGREDLSPLSEEQRGSLLTAKLGALVRDGFAVTGGAPSPFPGGASLFVAGALYALVEDDARSIGPALALAHRHGADAVHILSDRGAGRLAHQASTFAVPPRVWSIEGAALTEAAPEPPPSAAPLTPPPAMLQHLRDAGLEVVIDVDRVAGELRGLEVARLFPPQDDDWILEVGVGQADRELTVMLYGNLAPADALARVVVSVDGIRRAEAEPHPLNRLVPERWLRWVAGQRPDLLGAVAVTPVPGLEARLGLRERDVAFAMVERADRSSTLAAFSVGVDLDLVPIAAAARQARAADRPLAIVVPERDAHDITRALAAGLRDPATVMTVPDGWREDATP